MASRFVINNELTFTGEDLVSGSVLLEKATDLAGEELSADVLHFSVFYDDSNNTLRNEKYAVPIVYFEDDLAIGTFYLTNVERTASRMYTIEAASMVGILSTQMHYGGMYTAVGAKKLIDSVILTNGLTGSSYKWKSYVYPMKTTIGTVFFPNTFHFRNRVYMEFTCYGFSNSQNYGYLFGDYGNSIDYYSAYLYRNGNNVRVYLRLGGSSYNTAWISASSFYGKNVTLDVNPTAGTASCNIGDTTTTWDISAVQSTSYYTNNIIVSALGTVGGGFNNTAGTDSNLILNVGYYRIYNGSTVIFRRTTPYLDWRDYKFYWVDNVSGTSAEALGVVDWSYNSMTTSADPAVVTLSEERREIVNGMTYAEGVASIPVSGWLGIATKREQLYQILFALNINMRSNSAGKLFVGGLQDTVIANIEDSKIYDRGKEKPVEKVRTISLTEHVYTDTTTAVNTFDNRNKASLTDAIVQFENAPVVRSSVAASGLTLKAWNCNAALVSGIGYTTGYAVDHGRVAHEYMVSADIDGRDVTVSSATLVTYLNVTDVMNRLKAFYNNAVSKIENSIVYNGEQCGNKYSFTSPFGDAVSAFLSKFSASVSTFAKLVCTFYKGYVPPAVGTSYSHFAILTGSGTWTVPSGVSKFRAVIIGGGKGGDSGFAGENGTAMTYMSTVYAAEGGDYGANGTGGNIYEVEVTSPAVSYSYSCGAGGNGGAECTSHTVNNAGANGGNTTFGSYSSSSGTPVANGHQNLLNGLIYGAMLPSWNASSGKGGNGGYIEVTNDGSIYHNGENAYNYRTGVTYAGGTTSTYVSWNNKLGGGGGGASGYANGSNAQLFSDYGGYGADGANGGPNNDTPLTINASYYGYGGIGGLGGGGGGYMGYPATAPANVGKGGKGGQGMKGAPGCVIVYY